MVLFKVLSRWEALNDEGLGLSKCWRIQFLCEAFFWKEGLGQAPSLTQAQPFVVQRLHLGKFIIDKKAHAREVSILAKRGQALGRGKPLAEPKKTSPVETQVGRLEYIRTMGNW